MNVPHSAEPNVASLPPPEGDVAALLEPGAELRALPALETLAFPERAADSDAQLKNGQRALVDWSLPARAAPVLLLALNSRWESYHEALRNCQRRFSERAVHDLRVATRRLMSQLAMLSCVAHAPEAEPARQQLKRRLKALGALRDTHVLRLFVENQNRLFPELIILRDFLERRERRLEKSAAAKVKKFKTRKLEHWILSLGQRLARQPARAGKPDRLTDAVLHAAASAFNEVVRRREAIDAKVPATVHRTRIAFKRFRYTVEALSPEFTGLAKNDLRALARYQRHMGNLQDLEVVQACVEGYVRDRPTAKPLLQPFYRHLQQRRRRALGAFLKSADDLYRFWPPNHARHNGHAVPALNAA
jgi:CHAD domain-containing protein